MLVRGWNSRIVFSLEYIYWLRAEFRKTFILSHETWIFKETERKDVRC